VWVIFIIDYYYSVLTKYSVFYSMPKWHSHYLIWPIEPMSRLTYIDHLLYYYWYWYWLFGIVIIVIIGSNQYYWLFNDDGVASVLFILLLFIIVVIYWHWLFNQYYWCYWYSMLILLLLWYYWYWYYYCENDSNVLLLFNIIIVIMCIIQLCVCYYYCVLTDIFSDIVLFHWYLFDIVIDLDGYWYSADIYLLLSVFVLLLCWRQLLLLIISIIHWPVFHYSVLFSIYSVFDRWYWHLFHCWPVLWNIQWHYWN